MERKKDSDRTPVESDLNQSNDMQTQAGRVSFSHNGETSFVPTQINQYEIKERIGTGGMGEVYSAYDSVLKRTVALKILYGNNPALVRRFLQEARGQAQVEHDSICKVFATGEQHGRNFIAMQLINGKTLSHTYPAIELNQKILLLVQVAEAVHAAHKIGLIHRDIKPANIMVEKKEDGTLKPYILDFGLAREEEAPRVTMTGVVLGTPHYMAPEQAKEGAHKLDARTDVYSLGATLYEALTGRTVFEAKTGTQILVKLLQEDPVPVRQYNSNIPADVETIVMKCLEKDPAKRYQTALALAEDLRRYLNDEPILAKRITWQLRWTKKVQKNKTAVVILTLSIFAIAVLLGLLFWTQWKSRQQAHYAVQFSNEIRFNEAALRSTLTAPLHDVRPQLQQIQIRLNNLEKRIPNEGRFAYGPGYDALGSGYLLLNDYEKAKDYLNKAWSSGYQESSTAFALGKSYGFLFQQALSRADHLSSKSLQIQEKKRAEQLYGKPAVTFLKLAKGHIESTLYMEGLIALYENKFPDALVKAKQAFSQVSWPYEPKKLEGDVYMAMGREQAQVGNHEDAIRKFKEAGRNYGAAMELARSYEEIYLADADHWIGLIASKGYLGKTADFEMKKAVEACERAIKINPASEKGALCKAQVYLRYGIYEMYRSSPNTHDTLLESAHKAEEAASHWPNIVEPYAQAGTAYLRLAEFEAASGIDPQPSLKSSIRNSERALKLNSQNAEAYYNLAGAYYYQGDYELTHGKNPMPSLSKVIDIFHSKLEGGGGTDYDHNIIGLAFLSTGLYRLQTGDDPRVDLYKAVDHYHRGLAINPKAFAIHMNLGLAQMYLARYQVNYGMDPMKNLQEAQSAYDQSIATNDNLANAHNNKANVLLLQAEYEIMSRTNPEETLKKALFHCNEALRISPDQPYPHGNCASAHVFLAQYQLINKTDPNASLQRAYNFLKDAIRIDPQAYELHRIQANADIISARWKISHNKDPLTELASAKRSAEQSVNLNQIDSAGYKTRADVDRWESEWLIQHRSSANSSIQSGSNWIVMGKLRNPRDAEIIALEGALHLLAAKQSTNKAEQKSNATQAVNCFGRAFELNKLLRNEFAVLLVEAQSVN